KSLLPAIAVFLRPAIVADVADGGILDGVAVLDLIGNPIIKLFGLEAGIGLVAGDLLGQLFHLRREHDVRGLGDKRFERGVVRSGLNFGRVHRKIDAVGGVIVFDFEDRRFIGSGGLLKVEAA